MRLTEFYDDLTENNKTALENIKLRTGFNPTTFALPRFESVELYPTCVLISVQFS